MAKKLIAIIFFSFVLLSWAYATETLSHPVLQRAYDQANLRIDGKISGIPLDASSRKIIDQKKEQLGKILREIDQAVKNRDKAKIREQAKLFLAGYREAMAFVQNLRTGNVPVVHKNIPRATSGTSEITGKSTDITYYSDSFEWGSTANGNPFSQSFFSAAACDIPLNTLLQVGKGKTSVVVKLNDRPNCAKHPNLTDLTSIAFGKLGKISSGKISGVSNALGTVPKAYVKKVIPMNAFKDLGIALDDNIPNTYLKNETLHITGKELLGKDYTILYLKSPSGKDITLGTKKWPDGRFEYNYPLEEIGVYQAVLASGLGFNTSTFFNLTVLEDSIFTNKKFVANQKNINIIETLKTERVELPDFTSLYVFHFPSSDFHTLTLKSGQNTFVYRGFSNIAIRSNTLKNINMDSPIDVKVESQQSSTPFSHDTYTDPVTVFEKTMSLAAGHKEERNENITATEDGGSLIVRGIITKGKNVKSDVVLTLPDGNTERYPFDAENIDTDGNLKRGMVFEKTIQLKQKGLYLVEVNYDNGFAAYNGPIIYGDVLPIYPSELDSVKKDIGINDSSVVGAESLRFVNAIRARSGKSALSADETLNKLATIKAKNMAISGILSHTDSNGDKISGTAKRNGIKIAGGIGENIAGGNIGFGVLLIGLANSGGHRANMLDDWGKMGVGYAIKDGQVYYVQVFGE